MASDEGETVLNRKRKRKKSCDAATAPPNHINNANNSNNINKSTRTISSTTILPSIHDNLTSHYQSLSRKIFRHRMNFIKLNVIYYFIMTALILLISPPPSPKFILFTNVNQCNETSQHQQHHQSNYYHWIAYYFFNNHNQLFTVTTTNLNKVDATFNFITQQQQPTNKDSQAVQSLSYDQYNNQDQLSSSSNSELTQQQQQYILPINSPYFSPPESGSGMNPRTYQNNIYSGVSQSAYSPPSSQQFSTPASSASDSLITVKCVDGNDQDDTDCKQVPSYYSEDSIITPIVIFESSSSSSPSSVLQYSGSRDDNIINTSTLSSYTNLPPSSSKPSLIQDPFLVKTSFVATPKPSHDSHYTQSHSKNKNVNNTTNNAGHQCKDDDDDDCDDSSPDDNYTDDDDEDDDENDDSNNQTNQNSIDNGSGANNDSDDYGDDENGDQDYDDQSSGDLDLSSVTPISVDQHQSTSDGSDQQLGAAYTTNVSTKDVDEEASSSKPTFQPEQKAEIEVIIHSTLAPRLTIATTTPPPRKSSSTYENPQTEDDNSITSETTYQNKSVWSTSDSGSTTTKGPQKAAVQPNGVAPINRKYNSDFGSGVEPNLETIKKINENQDDDKPFVSYPTLPSISQQDSADGDNSQMTDTSRQDAVTSEAPQIYATFKPVPMPPNVINTYLNRYYENQPQSSQQQQSGSMPMDRSAPITGLELMGQSKLSQNRAQSVTSRVVPAPINQLRGDKMKQPNPNSLLYIALGSVIMMLLVVVSLLVYSLYCRPKLGARPGIGTQMVNSNYPIPNTFGSFNKLVPQPVAKNQPVNDYYSANMIVNTKGTGATKTSIATYNGRQAAPTNKKQYSGDDSFSTSYESSRSMDNLNGNPQYRRDGTNYQQYNTMRPQREGVYNTAGQQAPPLAPKPQLQVRHQVDSAGRVYNDYSQQGVLINGLMVNKKNEGADGRKSSEWYV